VKCRLLSTARAAVDPAGNRRYSVFQQGAGLISAAAAVASGATGCGNVGLDLGADIAGAQHFGGRARQQADGTFVVDGLAAAGSTWNGLLQEGGGIFLQGDPWTTIAIGLTGDPWTDTFAWPGGYAWDAVYLWTPELKETVAVNVWVHQQ
jgi:serine protease AprX